MSRKLRHVVDIRILTVVVVLAPLFCWALAVLFTSMGSQSHILWVTPQGNTPGLDEEYLRVLALRDLQARRHIRRVWFGVLLCGVLVGWALGLTKPVARCCTEFSRQSVLQTFFTIWVWALAVNMFTFVPYLFVYHDQILPELIHLPLLLALAVFKALVWSAGVTLLPAALVTAGLRLMRRLWKLRGFLSTR